MLRWIVLIGCAAVLAGCGVAIDTKLTVSEANEQIAVLLGAGITAHKRPAEGGLFDVEVNQPDVGRALEVLKAQGLPRQRFSNLGELFKKEGLVATPAEERVRFIYGLSQELERTLSHIDGVVYARVHIVLPHNDPLSDVKKPSSASVFIKHRPVADPAVLGPLIRSLVMRGVEGLEPQHVSVAFVVIDPPPPGSQMRWIDFLGIKVRADSTVALALLVGLPWLLLAIGAGILFTRHREAARANLAAVRAQFDRVREKVRRSAPAAGGPA